MTIREWDEFFDLLKKIVDMPNKTWEEKRDEIMAEATAHEAETSLDEFTGWF